MVGLMAAPLGRAQSPNRPQAAVATAPLAFDVVSVKPTTEGPGEMLIRPIPGGQTYIARNVPPRLMIKAMYRITDSQIVGGADWIDTEHYDIDDKVDRPSTVDQLHEIFRNPSCRSFPIAVSPRNTACFGLSNDRC
jgi:uncharacterized protein (TIGR03435 family)